jgi:hypothetical protein
MEASSPVRTLRAIPAALAKGFSEWQTLLALLWLTLLCASIAVLPDLGALFKYYGHAPLADGKPLISSALLLGVSQAFPPGAGPMRSLGVALLVSLPLTLFFTGGVVWRAWTLDRFRLPDFLAESGRMLGRVVRTLLWSFPLFLVCAGLVGGASAVLHAVHRDSLFTTPGISWVVERPLTGWATVHLVFFALLLGLWRLTLDTSRVLVLVEELRQTRKAVWRAFKLVLRSPDAWAAYTFLGFLEVVAVFLVMRLHGALPEGNAGLAWLALLMAQVVLLVRAGFQVSTTAFAAELVRRNQSVPGAAPLGFATGAAPSMPPSPPAPAPEAATAEAEPFELLTRKEPEPPPSASTSEMPLVDADLVEEEPPGGGPRKP